MNREIKFRVWDDKLKQYASYGWGCEYIFVQPKGGNIKFHQNKLDAYHGYVIQQYTGLKDITGKEIYEGDILKTYTKIWDSDFEEWGLVKGKFSGEPEQRIGHVWYANPTDYIAEWVVSFNHLYSEDCISYDRTQSVEVVGNTMENPELLKL